MSDTFDHAMQAQDSLMDAYENGDPEVHYQKTCKNCGENMLAWDSLTLDSGKIQWRLFHIDGTIHTCNKQVNINDKTMVYG
jgi:hypothetical protein